MYVGAVHNAMTDPYPAMFAFTMSGFMDYTISFFAAAGIFFILMVGMASYLRFERITRSAVRDGGGLPPNDAFQLQILQRIGSGAKTPNPFAVVLIRSLEAMEEDIVQRVMEILEGHVRRQDVVHILEKGTPALLLEAPGGQIEGILGRLLRQTELLKVVPSLQMSAVVFPDHGSRYHELLEKAQAGFEQLDVSGRQYHLAPQRGKEEGGSRPSDILDGLTGILKPDRMIPSLQKVLARHRKEGTALSLVYIDVDDLKRYNRHYGREGGDAVLKQLGALIETRFRETDLVGRYAGEEFLATLSCSADQGLNAARRFSLEVKKNPIDFNAMKLKITVCAGVAGFPEHGNLPRELFEAASEAMRAAKTRGRGSVALYEKETMSRLADEKK